MIEMIVAALAWYFDRVTAFLDTLTGGAVR
jgi:hypothetical protein